MVNEYQTKRFCKDDISLIENYDKAINDKTQTWDCHHRRETIYSVKGLQEIGEYYNRPACELIFLTHSEHIRLHMKGKPRTEDQKKRLSEWRKGRFKGMHLSNNTKKKMSEARKGKKFSESHKQKMSEAKKGKHWYTNGVIQKMFFDDEVPTGFIKGMKANS